MIAIDTTGQQPLVNQIKPPSRREATSKRWKSAVLTEPFLAATISIVFLVIGTVMGLAFTVVADDYYQRHLATPLTKSDVDIQATQGPVMTFFPDSAKFARDALRSPEWRRSIETMDRELGRSVVQSLDVEACGYHFQHAYSGGVHLITLCPGEFRLMLPGAHRSSNAFVFAILHEYGHAYLQAQNRAELGREEDAADAFAAMVALDSGETAVAIDGAAGLEMLPGGGREDEHEPPAQRGFRVRCLIGLRTHDFYAAGLVKEDESSCIRVVGSVRTSWLILRNHRK